MTKNHLPNFVRMVVLQGGTGNLTVGNVTGYPSTVQAVGTNKSFYYSLLNSNETPLETGSGMMINAATLRRDKVNYRFESGQYFGDGVPANIPAGAILITAPTEHVLKTLIKEIPLINLNNVSGSVDISSDYSATKLHLTANATAAIVSQSGADAKNTIVIHATSDNAGTATKGRGFYLTLPSNCLLDRNPCPPIPLTHDSEVQIELSTTDGGASYVLQRWPDVLVNDLGDKSAGFSLDIRYPKTIANIVDGATNIVDITSVSPSAKFGRPAHFTLVNKGSANKIIRFDENLFSVVGSVIYELLIPVGYRADFTVERNPSLPDATEAYSVYLNGVNYHVTASGLATTWNPADYNDDEIVLDADNRTVTRPGGSVAAAVRAFGGKAQGRWRMAVQCLEVPVNGSGRTSTVCIGFADAGFPLENQRLGMTAASLCMRLTGSKITPMFDGDIEQGGSVIEYTGQEPIVGTIYGVMINDALQKFWITRDAVVLDGGDPEAGTGGYSYDAAPIYYPCMAFERNNPLSGVPDNGEWKLVPETEDAFGTHWPSYGFVTA